jgi:hypothetical protein
MVDRGLRIAKYAVGPMTFSVVFHPQPSMFRRIQVPANT